MTSSNHKDREKEGTFGDRKVRAFDLEEPILKLRHAVQIVQAVEDALIYGPRSKFAEEAGALSGAVDLLVERLDELEVATMGKHASKVTKERLQQRCAVQALKPSKVEKVAPAHNSS